MQVLPPIVPTENIGKKVENSRNHNLFTAIFAFYETWPHFLHTDGEKRKNAISDK